MNVFKVIELINHTLVRDEATNFLWCSSLHTHARLSTYTHTHPRTHTADEVIHTDNVSEPAAGRDFGW